MKTGIIVQLQAQGAGADKRIYMPRLSETGDENTIAKWLVKEGQEVRPGDAFGDLETDKATMEWQCKEAGTVGKLHFAEGQKVAVGTPVMEFTPANAGVSNTSQPAMQLHHIAKDLTVVEFLAKRMQMINPQWPVIFSISEAPAWDQVAAKVADVEGIIVKRGSDTDRLWNFKEIADTHELEVIVRVTGDCMWHDPKVVRAMVSALEIESAKNVNGVLVDNFRTENGYPHGFNLDVFDRDVLDRLTSKDGFAPVLLPSDRLHVVTCAREFANATHAGIYNQDPFTAIYVGMEGNTHDPEKTPQLYCANPEQLARHWQIYRDLLKAGKDPLAATMEDVLAVAGTPLTPIVEGAGLTSIMSTRMGGTTQAMIKQNAGPRYLLLLKAEGGPDLTQ